MLNEANAGRNDLAVGLDNDIKVKGVPAVGLDNDVKIEGAPATDLDNEVKVEGGGDEAWIV